MRKTILISLGVLVFVVASTCTVNGAVVLIDDAHGQPTSLFASSTFSVARDALLDAGHVLEQLTGSSGALDTAALTGIDVYYSGAINVAYSANEIAALQAFVAAGGGVVLTYDGGFSSSSAVDSVNTFLDPFGIQASTSVVSPTGIQIDTIVPHCSTTGVQSVGLDFVRLLSSITPPAIDLTEGTAIDFLAVSDSGTGWVFFIGDQSLWTNPGAGADFNVTDLDNQQLLLNIIGHTPGCVVGSSFARGDTNQDGLFDISDAVASLAALFIPGTPPPACLDACDTNDDGLFDISDAVFTLASLFIPGSAPIAPPAHPDCGADPTADGLDCASPPNPCP
ncbi:MAG: hypothetical protein KDC38_12415 [Planctomycetes bacterium]|nr:hypothetical protein [Planctomycetota bacterium]